MQQSSDNLSQNLLSNRSNIEESFHTAFLQCQNHYKIIKNNNNKLFEQVDNELTDNILNEIKQKKKMIGKQILKLNQRIKQLQVRFNSHEEKPKLITLQRNLYKQFQIFSKNMESFIDKADSKSLRISQVQSQIFHQRAISSHDQSYSDMDFNQNTLVENKKKLLNLRLQRLIKQIQKSFSENVDTQSLTINQSSEIMPQNIQQNRHIPQNICSLPKIIVVILLIAIITSGFVIGIFYLKMI